MLTAYALRAAGPPSSGNGIARLNCAGHGTRAIVELFQKTGAPCRGSAGRNLTDHGNHRCLQTVTVRGVTVPGHGLVGDTAHAMRLWVSAQPLVLRCRSGAHAGAVLPAGPLAGRQADRAGLVVPVHRDTSTSQGATDVRRSPNCWSWFSTGLETVFPSRWNATYTSQGSQRDALPLLCGAIRPCELAIAAHGLWQGILIFDLLDFMAAPTRDFTPEVEHLPLRAEKQPRFKFTQLRVVEIQVTIS